MTSLEARLNVRLFHRTTRSVALTEAGQEFVDAVTPALGDLEAALVAASARRATPSGTLRINASASAARQMMPLILQYLGRHPKMQVDLVTEGRLVDIVAAGFDAGIRIAEAVPKDMIAIPLGPRQEPMIVGSPRYLAGRSKPERPLDLLEHRCIRTRLPSGAIWKWELERDGEAVAMDVDGPLTFDDSALMLEAALNGAGLAYLTDNQLPDLLATGRLVRVLSDYTPPYPGLCLYYSGKRHIPSGLRALIDLVREGAEG